MRLSELQKKLNDIKSAAEALKLGDVEVSGVLVDVQLNCYLGSVNRAHVVFVIKEDSNLTIQAGLQNQLNPSQRTI